MIYEGDFGFALKTQKNEQLVKTRLAGTPAY